MVELTDEEIKADLMNRLLRRGCWGGAYLPVDTLVGWVAKKVGRNGKRVKRILKELVSVRYVILHKHGETASLNPSLSREISDYTEKIISRY